MDIWIFCFFCIVLDYHFEWENTTNMGMGLESPPTAELMYTQAYNDDVTQNEIDVSFYSGMVALGNCFRLLAALIAYESFGTIIMTCMYMFGDVATFIVVWYLNLMSFAMVGVFVFQDIEKMETLPKSLLFFIDAAFGGYDLGVFDIFEPDRMFLKWFGIIFILIFVFLNLLILLNILIAMMADTYSLMTSVRKGLYNGNIIRAVPAYKTNKVYGGLLILIPPFSILSFLLLPFYLLIKDHEKLKFLTNTVFMTLYTVVAFFLSIYYIICNAIMMPFAYLKTIVHKLNLLRMKKVSCADCLFYVLIGLPLLLVAQLTDLVTFLRVSFASRKRYQSDEVHTITT